MEGKKKVLRKTYRKKAPIHHPLLALDIENDPKTGNFINAAIYGEIRYRGNKGWKVKHVEEFFNDIETFLSYL